MKRTTLRPAHVNPLFRHPQERRLSLDGEWLFRLDENDVGVAGAWSSRPEVFTERIRVPGCWQGQGFGHDTTDTPWDYRFPARVFRATYKGTGWYAKAFQVPKDWEGSRLWLHFGGVHPSAEVWLDGIRLGENDMPFVPFAFEVTDLARPGDQHWLAVRVHERNRQFGMAYNWQGNWSGLYRGVELTATGASYITRCAILPDVDDKRMRLLMRVGGAETPDGLCLQVSVNPVASEAEPVRMQVPIVGEEIRCEVPVSSPHLWSPDAPNLYRVEVALAKGGHVFDALVERTGFVKLSTEGKQFLINGEPYYMRGSGDFISCPETGCPDTDRGRWRRKLQALRDYGYNHVRCQSYVYPPEYFDAADEVGLLVQSEMGMLGAWGGHSPNHVYQWPKPTPDNYPTLKRQWDLVVQRDVNHPSANLYCMSNEYGASCPFPRIAWQCYRDTKAIKPTASVIWTDGGYNEGMPADFINAEAQSDRRGNAGSANLPLIQHEFRWWSSFPDVRTAYKHSGAVRPYGVDVAQEAAQCSGLVHLLPACAANSQQLQLLEAKVKMEMLRRDCPDLAGICHFSAMDMTPSPQGIIDEFYELKLADAATWLQTNGDTVLLCSLGIDDRVVQGKESWRCQFFVSDFSHPPFRQPVLEWRLVAGELVLGSGQFPVEHTPYRTCEVGGIEVRLPEVSGAVVCRLEAALVAGERRVENVWQLWLLPSEVKLPAGAICYGQPHHTWLHSWGELPQVSAQGLENDRGRVVLSERLDEPLVEYLRRGGRVLLAAGEGLVRPHSPNFGYVNYFFTPPANYPPHEDGQNGTIIAAHPLLGDYPHQGYADLQFFRLIDGSPPIDLGPLGLADEDPVLRVIHRYPVFHPLGYLVERQVGEGRLVLCALGLDQSLPEGRYLLSRMCAHLVGANLAEAPALPEKSLAHLVATGTLP
jgi:beta-galactosidase